MLNISDFTAESSKGFVQLCFLSIKLRLLSGMHAAFYTDALGGDFD
jgi:hypothetical protein